MSNSFSSYSFGCRVNQAEKEELDRQMVKSGFKYSNENPDIFIINTCAVTAKAEREARQLIYQINKKLPDCKIIITGCSATYWKKNRLYQDLPIELIVDNLNKEYLVRLLKKRIMCDSLTLSDTNNSFGIDDKFTKSGRLLFKIQEGCQRFCSYCIVPYLRGLPRSWKIKDIIKKIHQYDMNLREVILTAINTESFGYDTKESLIDLLKACIDRTKVPRISLGSIHPWSINESFFEFYQEYLSKHRLVNFFHIPLQSGSSKMLRLMKRDYTKDEFVSKLKRLHAINPDALIATDIIVGFLDETDKDFEETYEFLKESPISKFHIFRFSVRNNTAAYFMTKRLKEPDAETKLKRAKILNELGNRKYNSFQERFIGKQMPALFLENNKEDYRQALLDNQLPVLIKSDKNLTGTIANIEIIGSKNSKLFGKIV
jgi:threonylcarbamoyladenosine tRNA methylthiotransferase MtaB